MEFREWSGGFWSEGLWTVVSWSGGFWSEGLWTVVSWSGGLENGVEVFGGSLWTVVSWSGVLWSSFVEWRFRGVEYCGVEV